MMKYLIILGLLFSLSIATNINSCQALGSSDTYDLVNNLVDNAPAQPYCLDVQANDVIIDCHGFSITDTTGGVTHGISGTAVSNLTIKNCLIQNYTIDVEMTRINGLNITNNTITLDRAYGVQVITSNKTSIYNDTFILNNGGLTISDSSNESNVTDNFILNSTSTGLILSNATYTNVLRNIFFGYGFTGMSIETTANNNIITNNSFTYGVEDGIDISTSENNTITDNIITHNGIGGISNQEASNNFIDSNFLDQNMFIGVSLGGVSENNTVSNNNISSIFYGSIVSGPSFNNLIINNIIRNASFYGVTFAQSQGNFIIDNVIFNSTSGIRLQDTINNTVSGNNISTLLDTGITTSNMSQSTIVNNNINASGSNIIGINLDISDNNLLQLNNVSNALVGINLSSSSVNTLSQNQISNSSTATKYSNDILNTEILTHYYNNGFDTLIYNSSVIGQDVIYDAPNGTLSSYARIRYNAPITSLSLRYSNFTFNATFQSVLSGLLEIKNLTAVAQLNSLGFFVAPGSLPPNIVLTNVQLIKYDSSPTPLTVTYNVSGNYVNTGAITSFSLFYTVSYPPISPNVSMGNYTWDKVEKYMTNFYGDYDDLIYAILSLAFGFLLTTRLPQQLGVSFICLTISYLLTGNIIFISAAVLALVAWLVYKYVVG